MEGNFDNTHQNKKQSPPHTLIPVLRSWIKKYLCVKQEIYDIIQCSIFFPVAKRKTENRQNVHQ